MHANSSTEVIEMSCEYEMSRIIESKEESAVCCLEISVSVLELWYAVGSSSKETYVQKLNKTIPKEAIVVRQCDSCKQRIRVKACRVYQSIKRQSNWKRQQMRKKFSRLTIYDGEVVTVQELSEEHRYHEQKCSTQQCLGLVYVLI